MGKFIQHDIQDMVEHYRKAEQRDLTIRKDGDIYTPSTALTCLEALAVDWVKTPDVASARALKHCLEKGRGGAFAKMFVELHAFLYLIRRQSMTFEMARKEARKLVEVVVRSPNEPRARAFLETVAKEQRFVFQTAR